MPRSNAATFEVVACIHTQTCNFTFPGNLVCMFKIIINKACHFLRGTAEVFRGMYNRVFAMSSWCCLPAPVPAKFSGSTSHHSWPYSKSSPLDM